MSFRNGDRVIMAPGPEFNEAERESLAGLKGAVCDDRGSTFIEVLLDEPWVHKDRAHHKVLMYPEELVPE